MLRRILALAAAITPVAGAILVVIASFQTQALFPTGAVGAPGPLPASAKPVSIAAVDGEKLFGVHIPPARQTDQGRLLILGFGGNAWNGSDVAATLHQLYPNADVVAFHYRGYYPSTGSPSAKALIADAPLVHDFAVGLVKPARTVAIGFSIGSGIAASLASQRPVDGLILVTPFDSLKAAVGDLYPWMPVGLFFAHEIDTAGYLSGLDVPVALVAAERDTLIVPARTAGLRAQVPNLVFDRVIRGAGHNDIYQRPEMRMAMRDALDALSKSLD